jgi:hypothetical protein
MSHLRQMYAKLVRTAGFGLKFYQACLLANLQHLIMSGGRFSVRADPESCRSLRVAFNRHINNGLFLFEVAFDNSNIHFFSFAEPELFLKYTERSGIFGSDNHPAGSPIQPMDNARASRYLTIFFPILGSDPRKGDFVAEEGGYGGFRVESACCVG